MNIFKTRFPEKLQKIGLFKTDAAVALGSIIARAVSPSEDGAQPHPSHGKSLMRRWMTN